MRALAAGATAGAATIATIAMAWFLSRRDEPEVSTLSGDERVVFLDTCARLDEERGEWVVPVHAWVHELEESVVRKAAIAELLEEKYGLEATDATRENFDRRVRLFLVDNERGKRIVVRVGGRAFALPETGANGHAEGELRVSAAEAARLADRGVLRFTAVLPPGDGRTFSGTAHLVEPTGISIISDIDDTIKVTHVTDHAEMFDRTFFRDFEAAPGMAALYRAWAARGARFHFVSSSPWHLYEPLAEFTAREGFPPATFSLKLVRLKDSSFWNLFRKGTETKPLEIEPLLAAYPRRRFVLVGDSGEEDPEVYGEIARKHRDRIAGIYIRNVTAASADDDRFRKAFADVERDVWQLFTDPEGLELPVPEPE